MGAIRGPHWIPSLGQAGPTPGPDSPRHLMCGAATRRNHEEVPVPARQEAERIEPVELAVDHPGRLGPLCSRRCVGKFRDLPRARRHQGGEGELLPVRRPRGSPGRMLVVGQRGHLTRVHVPHPDLRRAVFIARNERDPIPRRRPARSRTFEAPRGQGPVIRAVGVDDPEIRVEAVALDVCETSHVDDLRGVGRDLGIGGRLDLEDIAEAERFAEGCTREEESTEQRE